MGGIEPFTPDDDYCVYCHAPAAGMCAACGALCCPDCVELVMGWTTRRAVCRTCAIDEAPPQRAAARALPWLAGIAGLAAALYMLSW